MMNPIKTPLWQSYEKSVIMKKSLAIMIGMVCITLLLTGCRDYDRQTVQYINLPYQEEAEEIMHSHGLNTEERYDQSVYDSMCEISEENIRGFYQLLGSVESEKAVKALGYEDWDDYLTKHGYLKWGYEPSFEAMESAWYHEWQDR